MTPALSQPTLAEHVLIRECLKAHGFEPTGRSRFSKGLATVHFEGTRLVAIPGDGSRTWSSDVGSVPPEAVVALLDAFLATPPFLSQQEIDRPLARTHGAKIALDHQPAAWATDIFTAWMGGHVSDELLRRALNDCGELDGAD